MRVLITTVTVGSGHLQAARALEQAWLSLHPDQVSCVDALDFGPRLYRKVYRDTYLRLIAHAPELWGMLFKKTDNPRLAIRLSRWRRGFSKAVNARFIKHLQQFKPHLLFSTHYMPLQLIPGLKAKPIGFNPFTVCVVTDFKAHTLWMNPAVDLYCVPTVETNASLVARGAPADRIAVTGIPISPGFAEILDAKAVRHELALREDLPVLLVLGGGFGLGPVAEIMRGIDGLSRTVQVVVVAGSNQELRRELASHDFRQPVRILGFVSNMREWMTAADLILTKPGGLTSAEALAVGRPILIVNPIPGQEAANSDFLLEHGAAVKANRTEDISFRLEQLLGSPQLVELTRRATSLGKPRAALEICRIVEPYLVTATAVQNDSPSKSGSRRTEKCEESCEKRIESTHETSPEGLDWYHRERWTVTETYSASGITNFFTWTTTSVGLNSPRIISAMSEASVSISLQLRLAPKLSTRLDTAA